MVEKLGSEIRVEVVGSIRLRVKGKLTTINLQYLEHLIHVGGLVCSELCRGEHLIKARGHKQKQIFAHED